MAEGGIKIGKVEAANGHGCDGRLAAAIVVYTYRT